MAPVRIFRCDVCAVESEDGGCVIQCGDDTFCSVCALRRIREHEEKIIDLIARITPDTEGLAAMEDVVDILVEVLDNHE